VAQYIYSKGGKAYSVIDRQASDCRVQIEIPPQCDAVRGLLKAVDKGLTIKRPKPSPGAAHDRTYFVAERRRLPERRDGYDALEVAQQKREERKRPKGSEQKPGRGSLYKKDEEELRRRRGEQVEPVIVDAKPRQGKKSHR
jgi:hypothetical protein